MFIENGLTYSILDGNPGNVFTVTPDTGEIRVKGALDYEKGPRVRKIYPIFKQPSN